MKKLFTSPKFTIVFVAEIALIISLFLTMVFSPDKEIVMFILGVLSGLVSAEAIDNFNTKA